VTSIPACLSYFCPIRDSPRRWYTHIIFTFKSVPFLPTAREPHLPLQAFSQADSQHNPITRLIASAVFFPVLHYRHETNTELLDLWEYVSNIFFTWTCRGLFLTDLLPFHRSFWSDLLVICVFFNMQRAQYQPLCADITSRWWTLCIVITVLSAPTDLDHWSTGSASVFDDHIFRYSLHNPSSVYTAELYTVYLPNPSSHWSSEPYTLFDLLWFTSYHKESTCTNIWSPNYSSHLYEKGCCAVIWRVPGLAGAPGNEVALTLLPKKHLRTKSTPVTRPWQPISMRTSSAPYIRPGKVSGQTHTGSCEV
jgi:hypothetical protein